MNGLGQQLRHRLAAAHVGAQRLGDMIRRRQVQMPHHRGEFGPLAFLQARIVGDFIADAGMRATFIVVGRIDFERRIEPQQFAEQAVVEVIGIAGRQIGTTGAADQERVAGEDAVLRHEAHRIPCVAGRMDGVEP
jgi:hypothetical protein